MEKKKTNGLAIAGFIGGLLNAFICNCTNPLISLSLTEAVGYSRWVWIALEIIASIGIVLFLMLACFGYAKADKYVKGLKALGVTGIILNVLALICSPIVSYCITQIFYKVKY